MPGDLGVSRLNSGLWGVVLPSAGPRWLPCRGGPAPEAGISDREATKGLRPSMVNLQQGLLFIAPGGTHALQEARNGSARSR